MRVIKHSRLFVAVFALLMGAGPIAAQTAPTAPGDELTRSRAALIDSTREYKASTEELLRLEEEEVSRAAATLEQLRQLFADGIIAKSGLEESERALAAARARLEERRRQVADSDRLISEIKAAEELAKSRPAPTQPKQVGSHSATATLIRYTGKTSWSVGGLAGVQAFFTARFGRPLPVSAVGQTVTHDRMGFDHRHAVDVALHPDSAEGQALINYLRSRGVPFLAFRSAVPGAATGPHIHIGSPSHRIT